MRRMTMAVTIVTTCCGVLTAATAAQAHISLHPNTIPAGAFVTLDVRVPGEQEGAYVRKVDVLFPQGFTGVDYENVPGWSTHIIEAKLATPIKEDGETIDTEVSQIVWTWTGPLGKVDNGQFIDFPLSLAIPGNAAGKSLEFRTVQTYSNGQIVHWISPSLTAEHPVPADQRHGQRRRDRGRRGRRGGTGGGADGWKPVRVHAGTGRREVDERRRCVEGPGHRRADRGRAGPPRRVERARAGTEQDGRAIDG